MLRRSLVASIVLLACHPPEPLPPYDETSMPHLYQPPTPTRQDAGGNDSDAADGSGEELDASVADAAAGLSAEQIRRVVVVHSKEVRRCYEGGGAPMPPGDLVLAWSVSAEGKVENAAVIAGSLRGGAVEACVLDALTIWQFPAAGGATKVSRFPFKFAQGSRSPSPSSP